MAPKGQSELILTNYPYKRVKCLTTKNIASEFQSPYFILTGLHDRKLSKILGV